MTNPQAGTTVQTPSHRLSMLMVLLLAAIYLGMAGLLVERALPNSDEGFYAVIAREVMRGHVPYRDFAYTQTPLLPYLQGVTMSVTGFGLREQRWINAVCGLATMLLAIWLWRRHGLGWPLCASLVLVWSLCIALVYYTVIGKTYGWAALWLAVSAATLGLRNRPRMALGLLLIAGVMAVGCRLTTAPAVLVLWLGLGVVMRGRLSTGLFFMVPTLAILTLLGPFYAADPRGAWFWTLEYHLHSALPAQRLETLWLSVHLAPVIALLGLGSVTVAAHHPREPGTWILCAGLTGWITAAAGPGVYADYAAPCFPLVLLGAGCLLARLERDSPTHRSFRRLPPVLAALAVAALFFPTEDYWMNGYLESVRRTGAQVRARTGPAERILTPVPEIAVEADRRTLPGLEMGKFGLTAEMDDASARQLHVLTLGQLRQAIANHTAPVIVLSRYVTGNFAWSVPSLYRFNRQTRRELFELMLQHYDCTYADEFFLVFEIKGGAPPVLSIDPAVL